MKSVISLTLVAALVISVVPVAAQEWIDPDVGPIHRAMASAAFRLAAEDFTPSVVNAGGAKSGQSDWSRVRDLEGEEIILTLYGSPPGKRQVVRGTVQEFGLTVLNLTGPTIPAAVADELAGDAWWHAEYFNLARRGVTVRVNKHMRIGPDGVFLDDRKVADLEEVIQPVARNNVAEIIYVHRATKRGLVWGALIGSAAGVAAVFASCGTDWNHETASCGNLTGMWLLIGPGMGLGIGSGIGATIELSTVVYRAPSTIGPPPK